MKLLFPITRLFLQFFTMPTSIKKTISNHVNSHLAKILIFRPWFLPTNTGSFWSKPCLTTGCLEYKYFYFVKLYYRSTRYHYRTLVRNLRSMSSCQQKIYFAKSRVSTRYSPFKKLIIIDSFQSSIKHTSYFFVSIDIFLLCLSQVPQTFLTST